MKAWIGAVALGGRLGSGAAMADGNELLEYCQNVVNHMDDRSSSIKNPMGIGQCFGMLEGVRDTLMVVNEALPAQAKFCFPKEGIDNGQAARIITKYLREHPADLHQPASFLTISAYKAAYPCK